MVRGWPDAGLKKKKKRTLKGGVTAAGAMCGVVRWSFLSQSQSHYRFGRRLDLLQGHAQVAPAFSDSVRCPEDLE